MFPIKKYVRFFAGIADALTDTSQSSGSAVYSSFVEPSSDLQCFVCVNTKLATEGFLKKIVGKDIHVS